MFAAAFLCACDNDEDFEKKYGDGSPLPSNILPFENCVYEYNDDGLVTKITHVETSTDPQGNTVTTEKQIASITYPQYNRAVMVYTGDYLTTTYVFAFGENHFANRVIESDEDGDTYMIKYSYDNDGHITKIDDSEDQLRMEWTDGNLTKIHQDEHNAYTILTYGTETDFSAYGISPFLTNFYLGPFMNYINWWFNRGLEYALYLGFLGKPCVNLPKTMTCYDDVNPTPEEIHFNYSSNGY